MGAGRFCYESRDEADQTKKVSHLMYDSCSKVEMVQVQSPTAIGQQWTPFGSA